MFKVEGEETQQELATKWFCKLKVKKNKSKPSERQSEGNKSCSSNETSTIQL